MASLVRRTTDGLESAFGLNDARVILGYLGSLTDPHGPTQGQREFWNGEREWNDQIDPSDIVLSDADREAMWQEMLLVEDDVVYIDEDDPIFGTAAVARLNALNASFQRQSRNDPSTLPESE